MRVIGGPTSWGTGVERLWAASVPLRGALPCRKTCSPDAQAPGNAFILITSRAETEIAVRIKTEDAVDGGWHRRATRWLPPATHSRPPFPFSSPRKRDLPKIFWDRGIHSLGSVAMTTSTASFISSLCGSNRGESARSPPIDSNAKISTCQPLKQFLSNISTFAY